MNSSSLKAGSGCLSTTGAPAASKKPIPLPSTLRWLCASSESGASSSQNVARTGVVPEVNPNRRHMALLKCSRSVHATTTPVHPYHRVGRAFRHIPTPGLVLSVASVILERTEAEEQPMTLPPILV